MTDIQMYLQMSLRRKAAAVLVILFTTAVTAFLLLYPQLIQRAEKELDHAYDSVAVWGWVLNANGYNDPEIPPGLWQTILDTGLLEVHHSAAQMRSISIPPKQTLSSLFPELSANDTQMMSEFTKWIQTQYRNYTGTGLFKDPFKSEMWGVSTCESVESLQRQQGNIRWLPEYDNSFFLGNEKGVVVPESLGYDLGDTLTAAVFLNNAYRGFQLKVVGIIPDGLSGGIYCPVATMADLYRELNARNGFAVRKMAFSIRDNRQIDALKDSIRQFGYSAEELHISIDDRALRDTVGPIQSNVDMLRGLRLIFFLAVASIGFVLCFLLVRRRKQEFAVMRLLGEKARQITGKALLEQALLCLIGVVLGMAIVLVSGLGKFSALTCGGVLICYSIGSALAVMLMVRVNVMEILRDKE